MLAFTFVNKKIRLQNQRATWLKKVTKGTSPATENSLYESPRSWSYVFYKCRSSHLRCSIKKVVLKISQYSQEKKHYGPLFKDGVQLPQGLSHVEETVYFLPLSSHKSILSTSEGWKAASTLEPPSGFEHETPRLGIQRPNLNLLIVFL